MEIVVENKKYSKSIENEFNILRIRGRAID